MSSRYSISYLPVSDGNTAFQDPQQAFQPDTGKIEVYRSAGGNGVRLDASSGFAGAQITPHYDSLLVKISVKGATFEVARRKMLRALVEFRIRGVKTNIPFLFRVLSHEVFLKNQTWTTVRVKAARLVTA